VGVDVSPGVGVV